MKRNLITEVQRNHTGSDGGEDLINNHFRSHVLIDLTEDFLEGHIQDAKTKIFNSFEEFMQRGSGWVMEKLIN